MNTLVEWLNRPSAVQLGWMLVHFMWQGALLGLLWAGLRRGLRARSARARYLAGCLVLVLMGAAPVVTWVALRPRVLPTANAVAPAVREVASAASTALTGAASALSTSPPVAAWLERMGARTEGLMPWLVAVWLAGVMALSLRLCVGWARLAAIRRKETEALADRLAARLEELRRRMCVTRPVRLLQSAWVNVPTVVGWLKPVILLPASSLTGLSAAQLELVVAHELAHIRRHDPWVNLLQVLLETLLFYHPAVWWVSREVREEREQCCDDLAIAACGDRLAYAQALVALEEQRQAPLQFGLAVTGGSLLNRVRRIAGGGANVPDRRQIAGTVFLTVGLFAVVGAAVCWVDSPALYEAVTRLQIDREAEASSLNLREQPAAALTSDSDYLQTQYKNLLSRSLIESVIKQLKLNEDERYRKELDVDQAVADDITVAPVRLSRLVDVKVEHTSAKLAANIANTLANEFIEQNSVQRQKRTLDMLFFLRNQASALEQDVTKAEEDLFKYRLQTRFVSLDKGENPIAETLNLSQAKYSEARARARTARTAVNALERHVAEGRPLATFPPIASDPQLRQVQLDLVRLETELAGMQNDYATNHPTIRQVQSKIGATRAASERMAQDQAAVLRAEAELASQTEGDHAAFVKECEQRQTEWNQAKMQYDVLQRKAETCKELFNAVLSKAKGIELVGRDRANNIHVVDAASPPLRPVYPLRKPALLLLGFAVLLFLFGLALASGRARTEAATPA